MNNNNEYRKLSVQIIDTMNESKCGCFTQETNRIMFLGDVMTESILLGKQKYFCDEHRQEINNDDDCDYDDITDLVNENGDKIYPCLEYKGKIKKINISKIVINRKKKIKNVTKTDLNLY